MTSDNTSPTPNTQHPTPNTRPGGSPIADLSYRNYDGPVHTRAIRWWIVTVNVLRLAVKTKGFVITLIVASMPYLFTGIRFYLEATTPVGQFTQGEVGQKYALPFFQAFGNGISMLMLFVLALMVGAGSVASDNQSNALLVYLSKPITKGDYLLGKWMGIFLVLFGAALVPALLLWVYCLLSYVNEGFLKEEPWLLFRVIGAAAVPALLHSSLLVGFSAWSKTARMAGAAYAGLYFVSSAAAGILFAVLYGGIREGIEQGSVVRNLSVQGIIEGLAQSIYSVTNRLPFGNIAIPPPPTGILALLAGMVVLIGIGMARSRIRAVEVVRG